MSERAGVGVTAGGAALAGRLQRFAHDAMACTFELLLVEEDAKYAGQAAEAALDELNRLERVLSRFVEASSVAQLARTPAGRPLRVDIEVLECLTLAEELRLATGGCFDAAVRSRRAEGATGDEPLFELRRAGVQVVPRVDGLQLDLGGIGKGYALDCLAALLADWRITTGLLSAGGSTILALPGGGDGGQAGPPWSIELRLPAAPAAGRGGEEPPQPRPFHTGAWAGSGAGRQGGHIVDPRVQTPADTASAAWVYVPATASHAAAWADALSTAFMLMAWPDVVQCVASQPGTCAVRWSNQLDRATWRTCGPCFATNPPSSG